jgi:hypothetical protein
MNLKELKQLAEKATNTKWEAYNANEGTEYSAHWKVADYEYFNPSNEDKPAIDISIDYSHNGEADAQFIAACNPTTVIQLIESLELATKSLKLCIRKMSKTAWVEDDCYNFATEAINQIKDKVGLE